MVKWELLEYFTSVLDGSHPLKRFMDSPKQMEVIKNIENMIVMDLWLVVL